MLVSDRFLVALGEFLVDELGWVDPPRLRDWSGTKGAKELILDADEPEEHEGLDGVFSVSAVVCLKVRTRDASEADRRGWLGDAVEALRESALAFLNDPENARGLGEEELRVFDLRNDDGVWEVEDKWLNGKVMVKAVIAGVDG
jgi:hypothetical protein